MKKPLLHTLDQAELAFYLAFEAGDVEAMMAVWSEDGDIVCIHPHGPRLVGPQEIRDGWQRIFEHSPRMKFDISELNTTHNDELAIRMVTESIRINGTNQTDFIILATNVYRHTAIGWRIILHHASPTPESLFDDDRYKDESEEADETTIH